jgi:hypothetical protein
MAGALISTVSDALKYRYLGNIQGQLNNEILVAQLLDLDSKNIDLDGLKAKLAVHHGRSTGIGARLEDEDLPAAGNQRYGSLEFDLAYLYGRARFSGQAIQKTKTDAGAFMRVVTDELDRLRDDLALDTARQYYGDGTGAIASIPTGAAANATQTLNSAESLIKGFLYPGMIVDVGTLASPRARGDSVVISDVDVSAGTVTFTAVISPTNGDFIFREDNNAASSVTKEINAGLQALLSTSSATVVGGQAASTAGKSYWDNQRDATGGAISLDNLMKNWNKVAARGAKASEVIVLTTPGLVRRLFASTDFQGKVQHVNTQDLKGGFQSVAFNAGSGNMTLAPDRLAPFGRVNFVHKKHIKVFSPGDWDFLQRDGLTIRWVDNRDAFQAVLFRYVNLGTNRRNTSLAMTGLTDTDGF